MIFHNQLFHIQKVSHEYGHEHVSSNNMTLKMLSHSQTLYKQMYTLLKMLTKNIILNTFFTGYTIYSS